MNLKFNSALCAAIIFFSLTFASGNNLTISSIVSDIDSYKNKSVSMTLKLKYIDRIFERIVFYDSENIDIEFDISEKELKKRLQRDMLNIHEGMACRVSFFVKGPGHLGGLMGDLQGFKPAFLDKIP